MKQTILILSRQKPHTVLALVASILSGFTYTLGPGRVPSIDKAEPPWVGQAWGWSLITSGLLGLLGIIGQRWDAERGLRMERGALLVQSAVLLIYATALITVNGWSATVPAMITLAWAGGNIWEAHNLWRDLRTIEEVQRA